MGLNLQTELRTPKPLLLPVCRTYWKWIWSDVQKKVNKAVLIQMNTQIEPFSHLLSTDSFNSLPQKSSLFVT